MTGFHLTGEVLHQIVYRIAIQQFTRGWIEIKRLLATVGEISQVAHDRRILAIHH